MVRLRSCGVSQGASRSMKNEIWLHDPEDHDFPAAADYLELHFPRDVAAAIVTKLRKAETTTKKAKDVLRAAGLPLLDRDNIHVREDLKKVKEGKTLSPVLGGRKTAHHCRWVPSCVCSLCPERRPRNSMSTR